MADPSAILLRAQHAVPLAQFGGLVGINGLTALLAPSRIGQPEAGDSLLVSTAAGGGGSLVGQIGRLHGCRTIGLTGDEAKVAPCLSDYGYEVVFNHRTTNLGEALEQAAPGGLNIYYSNVDGPILDSCLRRMAIAGRFVQCGTASVASWTPQRTRDSDPPPNLGRFRAVRPCGRF